MKKKILILENFVHFRNAIETKKIFSLEYNCSLIVNVNQQDKIEKKNLKNALLYKGPNFLVYLYILIISKKYDYIIISTLPEYPENLKTTKNIFFTLSHYSLFFFSFIFIKKKLIFQIRNIHAFIPRKKTILSKLRFNLLNLSNKYIFENRYLSEKFKKNKIFKNKKITYQYINHYNDENKKVKINNKYIGILGAIDNSKKDYDLLLNGLWSLKKKNFEFTVIFLGKLINKNSIQTIRKFSDFKIKFFKKYISEEQFKKWGYKCKFLISPLKIKSGYGQLKPTGSFGDSIYLNRKLLINYKADPYKEFQTISSYFYNKNDFFYKIKKNFTSRISSNPRNNFPDRKDNIKRIKNDLSI